MNIFFICLASLSMLGTAEVMFVNRETGFVVMEQIEDKLVFHDPILEAEMISSGIAIPPEHQERYGKRERVKLGENQFFKAFQEFYSVYIYDSAVYEWKSS